MLKFTLKLDHENEDSMNTAISALRETDYGTNILKESYVNGELLMVAPDVETAFIILDTVYGKQEDTDRENNITTLVNSLQQNQLPKLQYLTKANLNFCSDYPRYFDTLGEWDNKKQLYVPKLILAPIFRRDGEIFCKCDVLDSKPFARYDCEVRGYKYVSKEMEVWAKSNFGYAAHWEWVSPSEIKVTY